MKEGRILQWEVVLHHLATCDKLTSIDAIGLYGITRLSAVIKQCEKHGAEIVHTRKTVNGKRWGTCSIVEYRMDPEEQERHRAQKQALFDLIENKFSVRW